MPTGYTAAVKDGITFEKFVWSCARGMGALVMMRDEPSDAPIPERFEPSDYYAKEVEKARTELSRLKCLTREQASAESAVAFQRALAAHDEAIVEKLALRVKYIALIAQVEQWSPPTEEHIGLKDFMLQQLRDSVKWDCDTEYYEKNPPECRSTDGFLAVAIAEAERSLKYYEKAQAEEIERTEGRNEWLAELRKSVPPLPDASESSTSRHADPQIGLK